MLAGKPSVEVRAQVEKLKDKCRPEKSLDGLRMLRAVEVLEHVGTPDARHLLRQLAEGAPEARVTREAKAALRRSTALSP